MTIKTLPPRFPVLGRLRFGDKEPVMKDGKPVMLSSGKPKMRPAKASVFRFTSDDEYLLKAVASHFGGEVTPWPNGEQEWSLTSETGEIECLLPPNPVDTAYELYGSGGCQRRCDGEQCDFLAEGAQGMFMDSGDCRCLAEGKTPGDKADATACNVTVRIRILMPDLPGIGVWMGTSHSVYAAMELPAQVALVQAATAHLSRPDSPVLVPAVLFLDHREQKRPQDKYKRDFYVVSLRVRASMTQLDELARSNGELVGAHAAVDNGARPALQAGGYITAAGTQTHPAPVAQPTTRGADSAAARPSPKPATPPHEPAAGESATGSGGEPPDPTKRPGAWLRFGRIRSRDLWPELAGHEREKRLDAITHDVTEERVELFSQIQDDADGQLVLDELTRLAGAALGEKATS